MKLNQEFIQVIEKAKRIGILTGAGISADSGIITFRGKNGLWNNIEVQKLATLKGFLNNPEFVWQWYDERRIEIAKNKPNPGHLALASLEKYFDDVSIITQNVDGYHQKAQSTKVIELHGSIWEFKCMECEKIVENFDAPLKELPPKCDCGGLNRPNVVWFGEAIPQNCLDESLKVASESEIFFIIGTSAIVQPAASIPIIAKRSKAFLVEINLEDTPLTPQTDISFKGKAKDILPELLKEIKKIKGK